MANKNENVEFEYYGIFLGWQAKHKIRKIFHLFCVPLVHIYFIVATQVRKLANPLFTRVCEFFCFTIKTASEQPLTTARKLMLYLSYIAYPCTIFLLAHDPIPHSPVNKTQNPACRHRQPYCRYAYDRY